MEIRKEEREKWERRLRIAKYVFLVVLALTFMANFVIDPDDVAKIIGQTDLKYTKGVKAPFYALLAALALMASMVNLPPEGKALEKESPNMALSLFSVIAATFTAWVWLETATGATEARPWPYLIAIGILAAFLSGGIFIGMFLGWLTYRNGDTKG